MKTKPVTSCYYSKIPPADKTFRKTHTTILIYCKVYMKQRVKEPIYKYIRAAAMDYSIDYSEKEKKTNLFTLYKSLMVVLSYQSKTRRKQF